MSRQTMFHATRHKFDTLREGSWLSDKAWEAGLHLMMKNMGEGRPRLDGFLITFPFVDLYLCSHIQKLGDCYNVVTDFPLMVHPEHKLPLREAIDSFPDSKKIIFFAEEIMDLKPFLTLDA